MYIVDFCTATIDSTSFRFNYSPYVGGALASTFARLIFKNSEFIRNRAIERGGVLSAELGLFDFDNITAFGNFAANGAFANIITGSTLTTKNSNFRDHLVSNLPSNRRLFSFVFNANTFLFPYPVGVRNDLA